VSHSAPIIRREHRSPARHWATFASGVMLVLGVLTMLRSGSGEWDVVHAREVVTWPGHFLTGVAELAIGLTGVWCATQEHLTRGWLTVSGILLAAWAVAGLVLDGDPNDVFTADPALVAIHGLGGLVGLVLSAWSAAHPARSG